MKQGNWIAIDKALIYLMPKDRPYSIPEAMISLSVDLDNGKEPSINGCSKLWGWSRNKVRKFVTELRTGRGHLADSKGTYKGHLITLKINGFRENEDSKRTVRGQLEDSKRDTTIKTKTKTKTKKEQTWILPEGINPEVWQEYEDHRKTTKAKLTDAARTKNANVLLINSGDQQEIVDATIANGWTGLFPLKKGKTQKATTGNHVELTKKDYSEGVGENGEIL